MIPLLALFGCAPPPDRLAGLPASFTPTAVLADAGAVLGFEGGPFAPLAERRLAAWRVGAASAPVGPGGPGWWVAGNARDGELWAVSATPGENGSLYRLWVERGGTGDWEDRGPIPASSLTAVAVEGGGAGWAVGVRQLWRTDDGGASWHAAVGAPAPGETTETLAVLGPGRLVVGGGALLRTDDAGTTWTTLSAEPAPATDGGWVVSGAAEPFRVGRIDGATIAWTGTLPAGWFPVAVRGGDAVRVCATRRGGVGVLISTDGGRSFNGRRVGAFGDPKWLGLADSSLWVDLDRTVRRSR